MKIDRILRGTRTYKFFTGLLLMLMASASFAQKPTLILPAPNDEVRGDGTDGKNILSWTTTQLPNLAHQVIVAELSSEGTIIGGPIPIDVFTPPIPAGPDTYEIPFNFNQPALAPLGSGRLQIQLRAVDFGFTETSDPVDFFKGRANLILGSFNTDDADNIQFQLTLDDPDDTSQYSYSIEFVPLGGGTPIQRTTGDEGITATTVSQDDFPPFSLESGVSYNFIFTVTDSRPDNPNNPGLTSFDPDPQIHIETNDIPTVSIDSPTNGALLQEATLPASVPIQIVPSDASGGLISFAATVNGAAIAAPDSIASGQTRTFNAPTTPGVYDYTVIVTPTDSLGLAGDAAQVTYKINLPPAATIASPGEGEVLQHATFPATVPVNITATDEQSGTIDITVKVNDVVVTVDPAQVANGVATDVNIPTTEGVYAYKVEVQPVDGDGATGDFTTALNFRINLPPTLTVTDPGDDEVKVFTAPSTQVPFTLTATDERDDPVNLQIVVGSEAPIDTTAPSGQQAVVNVEFTAVGVYEITLQATDNDGAQSDPVVITNLTLNDVPSGVEITSPTEGERLDLEYGPLVVDFDATVQNAFGDLTYTWDFGDGSAPLDAPPPLSHDYWTSGSTTAQVTVVDEFGAGNISDSVNFKINDIPQVRIGGVFPALFDDGLDAWVVKRDQEFTVYTMTINRYRENPTATLRYRFMEGEAYVEEGQDITNGYELSVRHTFTENTAEGVYHVFRVEAEETMNEEPTTVTGSDEINIKVADGIDGTNSVKNWAIYR